MKISLDCRPYTWGYPFSEEILFTDLRARLRKTPFTKREKRNKEKVNFPEKIESEFIKYQPLNIDFI